MDESEKERLHTIFDLVMGGTVTTWPQLEIQGTLRGIEIDDKMFVDLMRYLSLDKFYKLYYKSLNESDDCLRFLENPKVIDYILMMEGRRVVCERTGHSLFPEEFKFSCVEFLGNAELLHPAVFLKYFLKGDSSSIMESMKTGYLALLRTVIKRTKLRAKQVKEYEKFIPQLEERYNEYCNTEMFLN
jgi:hypothetical protein